MILLKLYLLNHKKKIKRKKALLSQVYISYLVVMESYLIVSSKELFIVGDMNINSLDYETESIVENFLILPIRMEYSQLLRDQHK